MVAFALPSLNAERLQLFSSLLQCRRQVHTVWSRVYRESLVFRHSGGNLITL